MTRALPAALVAPLVAAALVIPSGVHRGIPIAPFGKRTHQTYARSSWSQPV